MLLQKSGVPLLRTILKRALSKIGTVPGSCLKYSSTSRALSDIPDLLYSLVTIIAWCQQKPNGVMSAPWIIFWYPIHCIWWISNMRDQGSHQRETSTAIVRSRSCCSTAAGSPLCLCITLCLLEDFFKGHARKISCMNTGNPKEISP